MKALLQLITLLLLLLPAGALLAQTSTPVPADTSRVHEEFEFSEGEMPTYDYDALAREVRYPEDARQRNVEGTVVLSVLLDTNGAILKIDSQTPVDPVLVNAAVAAVVGRRFTPGKLNGVPVRTRISLPFRFELGN